MFEYNNNMNKKNSIIKEVKTLTMDRDTTLTELARQIGIVENKHYTLNNLSQKLRNETISYREIKLIAEILDYEIKFVDKRRR